MAVEIALGDELSQMRTTLGRSHHARYVFDEGEQGQPAFEFRRDDSRAFLSIIASQLDEDVKGDPDWQDVSCDLDELLSSVARFLDELRQKVNTLAPHAAAAWWQWNIERH